jgi:hypothetical protein
MERGCPLVSDPVLLHPVAVAVVVAVLAIVKVGALVLLFGLASRYQHDCRGI